MIRPILCYGCEIWGYESNKTVESVHLYFCRRYCHLPQQAASVFVYAECGRLPLCTFYMAQCIKYWVKLPHMDPNRYPRQCYNMLKGLDELGRKTWAGSIKLLLFSLGFGFVWIAQDVGDSNQFMNIIKIRLKDIYSQKWHDSLINTSKTDTYKCYKSLLTPEKYLSINLQYLYKQALAKFRTSTHDLMIEKGRHIGLDRNYRYCHYCRCKGISVIESEFHFLFECCAYNDVRENIFGSILPNHIDQIFFYQIMSTENPAIIRKLAKFIHTAFEIRKKSLQLIYLFRLAQSSLQHIVLVMSQLNFREMFSLSFLSNIIVNIVFSLLVRSSKESDLEGKQTSHLRGLVSLLCLLSYALNLHG